MISTLSVPGESFELACRVKTDCWEKVWVTIMLIDSKFFQSSQFVSSSWARAGTIYICTDYQLSTATNLQTTQECYRVPKTYK
jgi:hypothetical protein